MRCRTTRRYFRAVMARSFSSSSRTSSARQIRSFSNLSTTCMGTIGPLRSLRCTRRSESVKFEFFTSRRVRETREFTPEFRGPVVFDRSSRRLHKRSQWRPVPSSTKILAAIMRTWELESIVATATVRGNVRVFGSVARGDNHEGSDVDVLIDAEFGRTPLDVIAFEQVRCSGNRTPSLFHAHHYGARDRRPLESRCWLSR